MSLAVIQRGALAIGLAAVTGGGFGLGQYGSWRVSEKFGFARQGGANFATALVYNIAYMVFTECARLLVKGGGSLLGEKRQYLALEVTQETAFSDKLRKYTWVTLDKLERVPRLIDRLFSRCFDIRTLQELEALPGERFRMEKAREVMLNIVHSTAVCRVMEMGAYKVTQRLRCDVRPLGVCSGDGMFDFMYCHPIKWQFMRSAAWELGGKQASAKILGGISKVPGFVKRKISALLPQIY